MGILRKVAVGAGIVFIGIPAVLVVIGASTSSTPGQQSSVPSPGAIESDKQASSSVPVESKWEYSQSRDQMSGKTIYFARLYSNDELNFKFPYSGQNRADLTLRRNEGGKTEVMFSIQRGQFMCHINGCAIRVRFDDGKISDFTATGTDDADPTVVFINNPARFIKELRGAKKLLIQATYFQEGSQAVTFEPQNLRWQ